MKKALVCITLSLVLLLALIACGNSQAEPQPAEPEPLKVETTTPEPSNTAAPEPVSATVPAAPVESETTQDPAETTTPETAEPETISEPDETDIFTEVSETVYAIGTVNMRSGPGTQYDKLGQLATGDDVLRIGIGKEGTEAENWSRVQLSDGSTAYINNNYLSLTKPAQQQQATTAKTVTSGGSGASSKTTQQATTGKAATNTEDGLALDGWEQLPNGMWRKVSQPVVEADTPATPQPTGPEISRTPMTDEEQNRASEKARKIYAGEAQLQYDEEGGYYYYSY